jgi:hypothetical protein
VEKTEKIGVAQFANGEFGTLYPRHNYALSLLMTLTKLVVLSYHVGATLSYAALAVSGTMSRALQTPAQAAPRLALCLES